MNRGRLIALLMALCLLWIGCREPVEPAEEPSEPIPGTPAAITVVVDAPVTQPPASPIPTPTEPPTIAPTATPEPTPTPHPFRIDPVTTHAKSEDFWYCPLNEAMQSRIIGSTFPLDPKDAPISIDDLRYVSLLYVDFEGETHTGEMVVHRKVADDVLDIFYELYAAEYPLASVKLLDDFGEPFDDNVSMAANNTSAFCCRRVTGKKKFSLHAYGVAIDVNPVQNPYIRPDKTVAPPNAARYRDRSLGEPGMIDENDLCYKLFTAHGWSWGGHFKGEKDYQHFSKALS